MPTCRLSGYVEAIGSIEAQESLDSISRGSAAAGTMPEDSQRQYVRELRGRAGGAARAPKATAATLALIGVSVETVEPDREVESVGGSR